MAFVPKTIFVTRFFFQSTLSTGNISTTVFGILWALYVHTEQYNTSYDISYNPTCRSKLIYLQRLWVNEWLNLRDLCFRVILSFISIVWGKFLTDIYETVPSNVSEIFREWMLMTLRNKDIRLNFPLKLKIK